MLIYKCKWDVSTMGTKGEIMGYVAEYLDKAEEFWQQNSKLKELEKQLEVEKAKNNINILCFEAEKAKNNNVGNENSASAKELFINSLQDMHGWTMTTLVHDGVEYSIATDGNIFRIYNSGHQFIEIPLINIHIKEFLSEEDMEL